MAAAFRSENAQEWIELGWIKQKGGKTVHAWAFEGDLPESFECKSNLFELEWPPRSDLKTRRSGLNSAGSSKKAAKLCMRGRLKAICQNHSSANQTCLNWNGRRVPI